MPYEVSWKDGGFYIRYFGKLTESDLAGAAEERYSHPRFKEIAFLIADCREVTDLDVRSVDVQEIARADRDASVANPTVRTAVVAQDARVKGLANVYRLSHEVMGGAWQTSIFETLDEARDWAQNRTH